MTDTSGLMGGKRGLIMGVANNRSIAWGIAKACGAHGAELALTYQGDASRSGSSRLPPNSARIVVGHCDVTDPATIDAVFAAIDESWGALDFLVHAIAFSDKDAARRPLCRHHRRQFRQDACDLLLLVHGGRAARREADAARRLDAHADLLRRREMDAAL